jgi:spore coat polysaccharide biosynthesis protein SpsF (cytidylyltransferase family)
VTLFIRQNPQLFHIALLHTCLYQNMMYRLTLDTTEDYKFLQQLAQDLPNIGHIPTLEICRFIKERYPNAVQQNINYNNMMKKLMDLDWIEI